jgi:hypothetical protein
MAALVGGVHHAGPENPHHPNDPRGPRIEPANEHEQRSVRLSSTHLDGVCGDIHVPEVDVDTAAREGAVAPPIPGQTLDPKNPLGVGRAPDTTGCCGDDATVPAVCQAPRPVNPAA